MRTAKNKMNLCYPDFCLYCSKVLKLPQAIYLLSLVRIRALEKFGFSVKHDALNTCTYLSALSNSTENNNKNKIWKTKNRRGNNYNKFCGSWKADGWVIWFSSTKEHVKQNCRSHWIGLEYTREAQNTSESGDSRQGWKRRTGWKFCPKIPSLTLSSHGSTDGKPTLETRLKHN